MFDMIMPAGSSRDAWEMAHQAAGNAYVGEQKPRGMPSEDSPGPGGAHTRSQHLRAAGGHGSAEGHADR